MITKNVNIRDIQRYLKIIAPNVTLGTGVVLGNFINLYGCTIGDNTKIGPFIEIQKDSSIGKNCKISSHTFICSGVEIGNNCFLGHGVVFINDNYPRSTNSEGELESENDWKGRFVYTKIGNHVSIGSNVTILGGIEVGDHVLIGAGSVVTKNIPSNEVWVGNPARYIRKNKG